MGRLDTIQVNRYEDIASRSVMVGLTNEALARFTGKVRKHNANLGVTLASWKQTADMIGGTSKKIAGIFDRRIKEVEKMSPERRRRIRVQGTAGAFLGFEFGWVPLVQDIQAGLGTLARNPPDSQWIRSVAKATTPWEYSDRSNPNLTAWIEQKGQEYWLCTISARVRVTSQNLFLANRLGLLNLPGVAWDLIPWSFVVNMFTNMAQMVNSLTDFVGVSLDMSSTTKSVFADISQRAVSNVNFPTYRGNCESSQIYKKRVRTLGVPTPTFQWRVPNLNLELVAILAALPLQRINKLNSLVGYRP